MAGIEKKRKKPRRTATVHFYENLNHPARSRSEALAELRRDDAEAVAEPDETKAIGNPHDHPGVRSRTDRTSPALEEGRAPQSADPMRPRGQRQQAFEHRDLRQGSTTITPWQTLSTRNQDRPDASIIWGAGRVAVDQLHESDTAQFTSQPSGNPNMRAMPHSAPIGASNGSHSLADPRSHAAPQATKGSDALRIMRETSRRLG